MSARSFDINVTRKQSNIQVTKTEQGINVFLHGHKVVNCCFNVITLDSCGWRTPTTKVAINNALSQLGRSERVSQVKGQWFINGQEFKDGMKL